MTDDLPLRAADAAEDLIAAVDKVRGALERGDEIFESEWPGACMIAHGLLREVASRRAPSDR